MQRNILWIGGESNIMEVLHCKEGYYVGCYNKDGKPVKVSKNYYKTFEEAKKMLPIYQIKY